MKNELIGQRIKELRTRLGLTQEKLAADIFISESYMTLIEQGKRNMSIDILQKLSRRLRVTDDYLLNGDIVGDNEKLFSEWIQIIDGREEAEIKAAHSTVRSFFDCLDSISKSKSGE